MKKNLSYMESVHRDGMIWGIALGLIILLFPLMVSIIFGCFPNLEVLAKGVLATAPMYWAVGIVEIFTYVPMLGAGGTYLSFITGNVTNMKIPCVMNSKDIAGTQDGTPEHEIVSTISVATSAITTTLVIVLGVILLVPLQPILQTEALLPAFNNVVPALFGALGLKYFIKSPKIAIIPLLLMSILCILVPAAIGQTSLLLIPSGGLALLIGYILYKKDLL